MIHTFIGYLLLIFCIAYASYGGGSAGYGKSHYLAIFIMLNVLGTSLEVLLLATLNLTRSTLLDFLGEQFIFKYLKIDNGIVGLVKAYFPIIGLAFIEVTTKSIAIESVENHITNYFIDTYGSTGLNWPSEIKSQYLEKCNASRVNAQGLISAIVDCNKESVTGKFIWTQEFFFECCSKTTNYIKEIFRKI
jgi:hypothetical protein